jgi:hypothetical protein
MPLVNRHLEVARVLCGHFLRAAQNLSECCNFVFFDSPATLPSYTSNTFHFD